MAIRWTVDPRETTRIMFDDPDFVAALEADATKEGSPLATLLGMMGGRAADADFSDFVAEGVYLDVRLGITAGEEDQLQNYAQQDDARKGVKYDVDRHNRKWFGAWVTGVGDAMGADSKLPKGLSSARRGDREDAVGALPAAVRGALFARLRVHTDHANRPAMRDPLQSRSTPARD